MATLGAERERILQILHLPIEQRYERVLDMLARTYAMGWLNHEKYVMGSMTITDASNPYLPQVKT